MIFVDPPTFSNSKRMEDSWDVQRDHIKLMRNLKRILRPNGTIVFSNNKRGFKMDFEALDELGLSAVEISAKTLPLDFERNKQIHNCWIVTKSPIMIYRAFLLFDFFLFFGFRIIMKKGFNRCFVIGVIFFF